MLRDTDSKVGLAGIEDANTCPHCSPDTYICNAHSSRESPAPEGIESESCDCETEASQQGYDAEEF
jgi:hypothetical protein